MGTRSRLFLRTLLLPAALTLGLGARANAQDAHAGMKMPTTQAAPSASQSRWSDPKSWPDGKVPREGDAVTIPRDKSLVLDVSPPALRSLTINGKLSFSNDKDLELKTEWIYVPGGELDIGSEKAPHTRKATITLTDNVKDENINTMGDRGIMLATGTLSLHGDRKNSWTKLAATAKAGAAKIQVANASGWRKGDVIVLASTDFDSAQAEERTVAAIAGNTVTLNKPLKYMHFGKITDGVDERGEVGLLTRNILIHASDDAEKTYFGGHIMAMAGSKMYVSGVELTRMGQNMHLARYPIHWHILGDGDGQYIENSSIHDTYSRCVTVHATNNLRIQNNVTYNTVGHCYFMEDAVEHGNQFLHNLAMMTKCHPDGKPCVPTHLGPAGLPRGNGQVAKDILIPSDNTASSFWITNPDNIYRDNVAAGSEAIGFWFALPEHPTGAFLNQPGSDNIWPRRTRVREFKGNTAHSNFDGFMFDRGPTPTGTFSVGGSNYHVAYTDPTDTKSEPLVSVFEDFTSYKNRHGGVWGRGELHLFKNLKVADNAVGYTHAAAAVGRAAYTSRVENGLFVGESENIGNPGTPTEKAYGRSLPEPELADFPIRGYEYYDLRHDVVNTTFKNFKPNTTRDAAAMSYLMYTSFGMSSENAVEGAKFINAKPVDFPQVVRRWSSDFGRSNAWRGAAIHDKDGSVGGVPNSYIVIDNGIADDEQACQIKPEWHAAVCKGDFGSFSVGGNFGFGGEPIAEPVMLSRNGRRYEYTGQTTVHSGSEVRLETSKKDLALSLREMDKGSWVIFELPGFTKSAGGEAEPSLAALRSAPGTAYFKDDKSLWVKLVVADAVGAGGPGGPGSGGGAPAPPGLQVSR